MRSSSYLTRRAELTTYFDQTAAAAWSKLTSEDPVGRIRATVRQGRDEMRSVLLGWLPQDLTGCRLLDAGCGTGALATEAARRGADVVAIDVAGTLMEIAKDRHSGIHGPGSIEFRVGDMIDEANGRFDYIVAMDSLIHYQLSDMTRSLQAFSRMATRSVVFTFAPRTVPLAAMHMVGRLIPHSEHRAPAIVPIGESLLRRGLDSVLDPERWQCGRTVRVSRGFYKSQAFELRCECQD